MRKTTLLLALAATLAAAAKDFTFRTEKPLGGVDVIAPVNVNLVYSPTKAGVVEYSAPFESAPLRIVQDYEGVAAITSAADLKNSSITVTFYYNSPLHEITMTGTGDINAADIVNTEELSVKLKGTGDIKVDNIKCTKLQVILSGTGDMDVKKLSADVVRLNLSGTGDMKVKHGYTDFLDLVNSGTGYLEGKIYSKNAKVMNSGTGDIYVYGASDEIDVTNSGLGRVDVKGLSKITHTWGNQKEIKIRK